MKYLYAVKVYNGTEMFQILRFLNNCQIPNVMLMCDVQPACSDIIHVFSTELTLKLFTRSPRRMAI